MKTIIAISGIYLLMMLSACSSKADCHKPGAETAKPAEGVTMVAADDKNHFGQIIVADGAIPTTDLKSTMGDKKEMPTKVKGNCVAVCKVKGCWMNLDVPNAEPMRVTFKDYGFFVPKDIDDKREVIVQGVAKYETTDVETLRHYAEDEGLSQEEINKITEPKTELVFVADGVLIP